MNLHPAKSMLALWLGCMAIYLLLPFRLLDRQLTWAGGVMLLLFIAAFIVGSMLFRGRHRRKPDLYSVVVDSRRIEYLLMAVSGGAIAFLVLDARAKDLFDLASAYEQRSDTANALLKGEASQSTIWFQLAFLLYPAAYVFTVVHLLYSPRVHKFKLFLFGLLPIGLVAVLMGGRMPILYALLLTGLAYRERYKVGHTQRRLPASRNRGWRRRAKVWTIAIMLGALFYYFATIFLVRAEMAGGAAQMFDIAEENWRVGFRGPLTDMLFSLMGVEITYLVFIFAWYLVHGFVMANYIFSGYEGSMLLGGYGIDLASAVMRRLDPVNLAEGFDALLTLGTYGFFPSAWGSLYVDFGYFGLLISLGWGIFAGLAYKRIVRERRKDWLLIGPFVSAGIALSTINTPFGVANGFVTHCWLLLAYFMLSHCPKQRISDRQCTIENQPEPI